MTLGAFLPFGARYRGTLACDNLQLLKDVIGADTLWSGLGCYDLLHLQGWYELDLTYVQVLENEIRLADVAANIAVRRVAQPVGLDSTMSGNALDRLSLLTVLPRLPKQTSILCWRRSSGTSFNGSEDPASTCLSGAMQPANAGE